MYEVPVKIYNISTTTKRVNIKHPNGLFKVDTDKKNKQSIIVPGMHLELLVIFETDQPILKDEFDEIVINSENDFKLVIPLKAYLPQPLIQFEPLINLGFVPVGTKKIDVINFINDGSQDAKVELNLESKNEEIFLDKNSLFLPKYDAKIKPEYRKQIVTIIYEPKQTINLHDKIEVRQITMDGKNKKDLGFIEVVATSVVQQMSIVFEQGGGPHTDINFGLLYYGQSKEISAFMVNNGPKEMTYKFNFHPNKTRKDFNEYFDNDDFASTPEETGLEITQRVLSAEPDNGVIKSYSQIPIKFLCKTKLKKEEKGWKVTLSPDYDTINKKNNLRDKLSNPEHYQSLAAIKFEEKTVNKLSLNENEEEFCKPISVFMEVKAIRPDITIDKTELNFDECHIKEKKMIQIVITNKNEELPVDFSFNKIPHFTVEPMKGKIKPSYKNDLGQITVNIYFHPENIGIFSDFLILKYINNMYEIPIKIYGTCKSFNFGNKMPENMINYTKRLLSSKNFKNERYNNSLNKNNIKASFSFKKNISDFSEAQLVPDDIAMDYTKKPYVRIDQSTRLQKLYKNQLNQILKKIGKNNDLKTIQNNKSKKLFNPRNEIIKKFTENFKIYEKLSNQRSLANLNIVKMRRARKILKPMTIKSVSLSSLFNEEYHKEKNTITTELMSLKGNRLESPKLILPEPSDKLWVAAPIGQYEPAYMEQNIKKDIGKTPDDMYEESEFKKKSLSNDGYYNFNIYQIKNGKEEKGGDIPRTHQEIRECSMELNGEELQKIQVGTKEINFGQIFINSEISKTFWIKNNLRTHIFVRIEIDQNFKELQRSSPLSHVISPYETYGFKISIFSNSVKKSVFPVKYIINYKHIFNLKVCADIIMAKLDIQNSLNKFVFKYEKIDKDKVEMSVIQKLKLFNGGNAPVSINFEEPKEQVFNIIPLKEIIPPKKEKEISISFNPFESLIQKEKYFDTLKMNIINGEPMLFPVEAYVPIVSISFLNVVEENTIVFDLVLTGVPTSKFFSLKNDTPKNITTYIIQNPLPNNLKFNDETGYITDKPKLIEVIFTHSEPNHNFITEIPIKIRGGKDLKLILKANIVQPDVIIEEDKFDFGGVCFNEMKIKNLTLSNRSELPASVYINLNADLRYKDFRLVLNEKFKNNKNNLIKAVKKEDEIEEEQPEIEDEEEIESVSENNNNEEDEEEEINHEDIREFYVTIPPKQSIVFDFIFSPNSFDNENLEFSTNFKLVGSSGSYHGLQRQIFAKKIETIVSISEMLIKFPKTFIYDNTKNYKTKEIKIASVNKKSALKWKFVNINNDKYFEEGIFDVVNQEGEIPSEEDILVPIKFNFIPREKKVYKSQITLLVTDSEGTEIYKTLRLEGEGLFPRIYIDKRELILPVVPLGIESSIVFKVKNEGYENEEIKAEFEVYQQGALPIKFNFLENNNIIGYSKTELKCEIKMISNKPISFTTRLIFFDTQGKQYPIMVSGTCDNCLFTNYSFFQREMRSSYELNYDKETKNINIIKLSTEESTDNNDEKKTENASSSYGGSSVNSIKLLGYNKVNSQIVEQNCKYIKKYLKKIHLDDNFKQNNTFKQFPEDVVKGYGKVIYILIKNLTGREPPGKIINLENDLNQRALQVREQYCQLIRFLQECGASLNTVYPEYLLDFNLYKRYIALDENRAIILDSKWEKSKALPLQWKYYHKESWVLLVYQILKIFYLSRITSKSLSLALRHLPNDIQKKYLNNKFPQSNIYSYSELILIKWLNACFEYVNQNCQKEIYNFSSDFSDSGVLTALILSYFPKEEKSIINKRKQGPNESKKLTYNSILNILKDYGIYTHIKNFQISPNNINAREILLLLIILFQNLQHFYPKDTITFSCVLGDSLIKAISLMNQTKRTLEYAVKYEGSESFTLTQKNNNNNNEIKIEPGKEIEYQITFSSKLSTKVEGKIYFINRKAGWAYQAAPIVYNLISNINGRRSFDYKIISTNLYSRFAYKLHVVLPFKKEKGEFEVRIEQKKKYVQSLKKGARNNIKNFNSELLYKAFSIKGEEDGTAIVKFTNSEGSADIVVYFLPVELETYICNLVFINESIGEFQYTIEGRVERPTPKKTETYEDICSVEDIREFYLGLEIENYYLKHAVGLLNPIENKIINGQPVTNKVLEDMLLPATDKMQFSVDCPKNFFGLPALVQIPSPDPPKELQKFALSRHPSSTHYNEKQYMWLKVKFSSKNCLTYEGDITLKNIDNPNDVRIYKLYIDVRPKDIKATLEFFCPKNETIEQKIPIENKSDSEWTIKAELTNDETGYFQVEKEKQISKHSIGDIILTFSPREKKKAQGLLRLYNAYTGEKYFYTLIGNVEDPLADGNIDITNINVKETQTRTIPIKNDTEHLITYTVETDLDDIISGLNKFDVGPSQIYNYEINIKPILGKIYFGRIIFRDNKNSYKWYTVRVEAKSKIQPKMIQMKTNIRKGVFIELNLENPTEEDAIFKIDFDSNLFLFGDTEVNVAAKNSKIYKLLFAPLKVGTWDNAFLHIYNDKIGEFLYKLKLISEEAPIFVSEIITAEIGKWVDYPIMLENPTKEEVEIKWTNNKKKQFKILQEKIYIPPGIKKEILIRYTPSLLDIEEECEIKFESKKIGNWYFILRGKGLLPSPMEVTYIRTYIGGVTSGQISFKNPLNEKISVNVELKSEKYQDAFNLFSKKNKYQIDASGMIVIPFTFRPSLLTRYNANILIEYKQQNIVWEYPLEGITEIKSKGIDFHFKTKSKSLYENIIYLDLSNLPEDEIDFSDFGYILNIKNEKYKSLINKCFTINFNEKLLKNKPKNYKKLPLEIKFYPLRPFRTEIEFVLRKKSGGQWIYNILLESTMQDPDDIINIKATLGKESYISFNLENVFAREAKFVAYFSHDSSSEFSVSPREGILEENGKSGTQFIVCYLPVEYGKVKIGKLMVETDEVMWLFEIRGTHTDYKPPDLKGRNVNNLLQGK